MDFVHLRNHTGYSMSEGLIKIEDLLGKVKENGMEAVAITDLNNIVSYVGFHQEARKKQIKPILGVDFSIDNENGDPRRITLLVKNEEGYANLNKLITRSYIDNLNKDGTPSIKREWLGQMQLNGLVCLSGALEGTIGEYIKNGEKEKATKEAIYLKSLFGVDDFFIELQRDGKLGQEDYIEQAIQTASTTDTPVVATNLNVFLNKEEYDAHDARVTAADSGLLEDPRRVKRFTREQYFRSKEEMLELFSDIPSAIENTVVIANKCSFNMQLGMPELPKFDTGEDETEDEMLFRLSREGLQKKLAILYPNPDERKDKEKEYLDRLETELNVIKKMGFSGYFLIVQDFIREALENNIPVGPGRGSGAGSLVAYSLNITNLDPLRYNLLFERFLNPERVSMPDFDIDFCKDRREEVIAYVRRKYGGNSVAQISTVSIMKSKVAMKDAARILGVAPYISQEYTNFVPKNPKNPAESYTLEECLLNSKEFKEKYIKESEFASVVDLAMQLEGTPRQLGVHAAGVVIAPRDISEFTPLYINKQDTVSHFDKDDLEKVGLVKFDFLGLETLSVIKTTENLINETYGGNFNIDLIPTDDEKALQIYRDGNTAGVFQMDGAGMTEMVEKLQPTSIEDIISCVALYRPGILGSGEDLTGDFISRKHGESSIEYLHPMLEEILSPTYGVMIYQEQVMQVAQKMGGYSLGGADLLRRAMGKKKPEEMAQQRDIFVDGAIKNGVEKEIAVKVFDLMEKFAGYGFNKSHSAAYGLISYQTAYLKAHYPLEFYASSISCKANDDSLDKAILLIKDAKNHGVKILPPDINQSSYYFKPEEGNLRYGFVGLKGVGESAAKVIENERNQNGKFQNLYEFGVRVGKGAINKTVKERLVNCGAMDAFGNRDDLIASMEALSKFIDANKKAIDSDKSSIKHTGTVVDEMLELDSTPENTSSKIKLSIPDLIKSAEPCGDLERIKREYQAFDYYYSGHPHSILLKEFKGFSNLFKMNELNIGVPNYTSGVVIDTFEKKTKKGTLFGSMVLSDGESEMQITMFNETYAKVRSKIKKGEFFVVNCNPDGKSFRGQKKAIANEVFSIEDLRDMKKDQMLLKVAIPSADLEKLDKMIKENIVEKGYKVYIYYKDVLENGKFKLVSNTREMNVNDKILKSMEEQFGKENIKFTSLSTQLYLPEPEMRRKQNMNESGIGGTGNKRTYTRKVNK